MQPSYISPTVAFPAWSFRATLSVACGSLAQSIRAQFEAGDAEEALEIADEVREHLDRWLDRYETVLKHRGMDLPYSGRS